LISGLGEPDGIATISPDTINNVPEPSAVALVGLGVAAIVGAAVSRRRSRI
jgi:hypothetical protein